MTKLCECKTIEEVEERADKIIDELSEDDWCLQSVICVTLVLGQKIFEQALASAKEHLSEDLAFPSATTLYMTIREKIIAYEEKKRMH